MWTTFSNTLVAKVDSSTIVVQITGLSSGVTYQFKYRAQNIYGWSPLFSDSVPITTFTKPHTITDVSTLVVADQVKIAWTQPYSGGVGIVITAYTIKIKTKTGLFITTADCDGLDPQVLLDNFCFVDVVTLSAPAFGLELGDLVVAKVSAVNSQGSSPWSVPNVEGALIETIPLAPLSAPKRGILTNEA